MQKTHKITLNSQEEVCSNSFQLKHSRVSWFDDPCDFPNVYTQLIELMELEGHQPSQIPQIYIFNPIKTYQKHDNQFAWMQWSIVFYQAGAPDEFISSH